jgi:hypothetical protein
VQTIADGRRLFDLLWDLVSNGTAQRMQQALWLHAGRLAFQLPFPEVPSLPLDEMTEELVHGPDAFDAVMRELKTRAHEIEGQKRVLFAPH